MQWKVCESSNKLASDAVRWQEDKYAMQQQQRDRFGPNPGNKIRIVV